MDEKEIIKVSIVIETLDTLALIIFIIIGFIKGDVVIHDLIAITTFIVNENNFFLNKILRYANTKNKNSGRES
jgi:hypothetical protein